MRRPSRSRLHQRLAETIDAGSNTGQKGAARRESRGEVDRLATGHADKDKDDIHQKSCYGIETEVIPSFVSDPYKNALFPLSELPFFETGPSANDARMDCRQMHNLLERIGSKWKMMVISRLNGGPMRLNALKRDVDTISPKVLTETLRGLEYDGLVQRVVTPVIPPRVDIQLTELGLDLLVPIKAMTEPQSRPAFVGSGHLSDQPSPIRRAISRARRR